MEAEHQEQEERARRVFAKRRAMQRAARRTIPPVLVIGITAVPVWLDWYDTTMAALVLAAIAYQTAWGAVCDWQDRIERATERLADRRQA